MAAAGACSVLCVVLSADAACAVDAVDRRRLFSVGLAVEAAVVVAVIRYGKRIGCEGTAVACAREDACAGA